LIVGAGECGLLAGWLLRNGDLSPAFSIVGMVDDNPRKEGLVIGGQRVFGLTSRIPELVQKLDIGVLLFAIENIQPEEGQRILDLCRQTSARLIVIPDLLALLREQLSQKILPLPTPPVRSHPLAVPTRLSPTSPLSVRPPELGSAAGDGQD
jgi:FlaA1/EpsC-like NDP-sugar epimerase